MFLRVNETRCWPLRLSVLWILSSIQQFIQLAESQYFSVQLQLPFIGIIPLIRHLQPKCNSAAPQCVNRSRLLAGLTATIALAGVPAAAETVPSSSPSSPSSSPAAPSQPEDGRAASEVPSVKPIKERWIPTIGGSFGLFAQDIQASVNSRDSNGAPAPGRGLSEGDDVSLAPFLGGEIGIESPEIPIPLRPRIFITGEVLGNFAPSRAVANQGNPSGVTAPEGLTDFGQEELLGTGSRTSLQTDGPAYGVALGTSIEREFLDQTFWIRPSVRYLRYSIEAEGSVFAGFKPNDIGSEFRSIEIQGKKTLTLDAIGPSLEIETELHRTKELLITVLVSGTAYWVIGDRELEFSESTTITDSFGTETFTGLFTAEVDRVAARANLGFRVHWIGGNPFR